VYVEREREREGGNGRWGSWVSLNTCLWTKQPLVDGTWRLWYNFLEILKKKKKKKKVMSTAKAFTPNSTLCFYLNLRVKYSIGT
jgi:hypothetical protein